MRILKTAVLAFIVVSIYQCAGGQMVNGKLHNRFVGYGINELYIYLTLQEDRHPVSQTKPYMRIPVSEAGTFTLNMPKVTTGGYTVRNFLGNLMGIYDNVYVSNESTLTMMYIRVNAGGGLSEYFGPCDDSTRGSKIGFYVHASKTVTVSGAGLNLTFMEGWNLMVMDSKTETLSVTSNLNSGWDWGTD